MARVDRFGAGFVAANQLADCLCGPTPRVHRGSDCRRSILTVEVLIIYLQVPFEDRMLTNWRADCFRNAQVVFSDAIRKRYCQAKLERS